MEYTDRYKAFCKRMSIYRKLMDYDQAKMAVRVGMTTPEYSNREAGRSMVSGIDLRKFSDSVRCKIKLQKVVNTLNM